MHFARGGNPNSPVSKRLIALRILVVGLFFLWPLIYALPTFAVISQPTSPATVSNFHVNRNLVQPGDMLIYANYNIPYTSVPNVTADQSFMFRLMDTTDTTELAAIAPYAYSEFDNGYNEGVFAFYFSNSTAPTWGLQYYIRVSENPSQFSEPLSWDYLIPTTAYSTLTSQLDNQAELASNIVTMASTLQSAFGHAIVEPTSGGMVLSSPYGESYFRGAIYGLQVMAPTLFLVQLVQLDTTSTNWTTVQFDTYEHQWDATWVGPAENATATQFGLTPSAVMSIPIWLLCIGTCVISSLKYHRIEPALVASSVFLIMGVRMGWLPIALFAVVLQTMGIYTSYVWFYARG